jgi:putative hemolysin
MTLPAGLSLDSLLLLAEEILRSLLFPFVLVLLGGCSILADMVLLKRRGDADGVSSFLGTGSRPRPGLRLASVFFFTLASILAARNLLVLPIVSSSQAVAAGVIGIVATVFSVLILLFGILIPRALGEFYHEAIALRALSRGARYLTLWIDPLAELCWLVVSAFLRMLGIDPRRSAEQSEEDVLQIMDEGLESGAFNPGEKEMVEGVLDLDEQTVAELMTPRSRVTWLDLDEPDEVNWRRIAGAGHSDYPVFQATHDNIRGIVSVKSLWANLSMTGSVRLADVLNPPFFVPSTMTAPRLLEEFRKTRRHTALVVDEFGVVEGMVTIKDVFEEIVGRLPERGVRQHYPEIIRREDGSWLVDAQVDFEETAGEIGLELPEEESDGRFQTMGGFVLHHLGHIPQEGEMMDKEGYRFEIVSMDRQRIDKLLVTRLTPDGDEDAGLLL